MAVTSMTVRTAPRRKKPKAGDTKMIAGVLHVRKQARVESGPHKGARIVNNGRAVWDWIPATQPTTGDRNAE